MILGLSFLCRHNFHKWYVHKHVATMEAVDEAVVRECLKCRTYRTREWGVNQKGSIVITSEWRTINVAK